MSNIPDFVDVGTYKLLLAPGGTFQVSNIMMMRLLVLGSLLPAAALALSCTLSHWVHERMILYLSFAPTIDYWLLNSSTYRVVEIQSQASWFVLTGSRFVINAHNSAGIRGNSQPWWEYFTTVPRLHGDGRPISLTAWSANDAVINGFRIESLPFWSNAVVESTNVVYDGISLQFNATLLMTNHSIVPNTNGIDTYRVDNVSLLNWDVTCGDDCLAIKGNTTNLLVKGYTCRGSNGIVFASLGQYAGIPNIVQNVVMEDLTVRV